MATQIITVLCEGPHDIAFICKILKSIGFKANEDLPFHQYPVPINSLLEQEVVKANVSELKVQTVREVFLPSNSLVKDDNYILLYAAGSDSKILSRSKYVIDNLSALIPTSEQYSFLSVPQNTYLSLICFLDADQKGIKNRLLELNKALEAKSDTELFKNHSQVINLNKIKIANFIFTGDDNNTGKLEDILIPLMEKQNEIIFEDARGYIEKHFEDIRLFKIDTLKDDVILVYTDGFADQFGGPKGKKFKYKQLKENLVSNHNLPLTEQKAKLISVFETWKGDLEQVDDVCVIGIRI